VHIVKIKSSQRLKAGESLCWAGRSLVFQEAASLSIQQLLLSPRHMQSVALGVPRNTFAGVAGALSAYSRPKGDEHSFQS